MTRSLSISVLTEDEDVVRSIGERFGALAAELFAEGLSVSLYISELDDDEEVEL